MQPELTNDVQNFPKDMYLRVQEAQTCGMHSLCVVPLWMPEISRSAPVAILEVLQPDEQPSFDELMAKVRCSHVWFPESNEAVLGSVIFASKCVLKYYWDALILMFLIPTVKIRDGRVACPMCRLYKKRWPANSFLIEGVLFWVTCSDLVFKNH